VRGGERVDQVGFRFVDESEALEVGLELGFVLFGGFVG